MKTWWSRNRAILWPNSIRPAIFILVSKVCNWWRIYIFSFLRFFLQTDFFWENVIGCLQLYLFFLMIVNLKVVPKELLSPTDLPRAEVFDIHKLTKVIVVGKNKNLIFITFQVVVPSLKDFNDGQKYLIIDLIMTLSKNHLLWEKSYRVLLANFGLKKNRIIFVGHVIRRILIQGYLT